MVIKVIVCVAFIYSEDTPHHAALGTGYRSCLYFVKRNWCCGGGVWFGLVEVWIGMQEEKRDTGV